MSGDEIIQEFLAESAENLDRIDRDLVELDKNPHHQDALEEIFRTIHTIKGTCGFLQFHNLEKVTQAGESLLIQLRDGERTLTPQITTALLSLVSAVRKMLAEIQSTGEDGQEDYRDLRQSLA